MHELISIVIPVYNVEKYLDECIQSVINQTYKNLQILLINDESTDSSYDICYKYSKQDDRIQIINKKNGGSASARNVGIDKATGEYIYFLDSDDYIKETTIEEVVNYMKNNNLDLCYFSADVIIEDNDLTWNKEMYKKNHYYTPNDGVTILKRLIDNNEYSCQNCMFISKLSLIKYNNLKYTEGYIYEDNYFAFMLALYSQKSGVLNKSFYIRRIRKGSIMTENLVLKRRINSYKAVLNDFDNIKTDKKIIKKLIKRFKRGFSIAIINFARQLDDLEDRKVIQNYFKEKHYYKDLKLYIYIKIYLNKPIESYKK